MSIVGTAQELVTSGPLLLAAPIALAAGALSFFSPCCLPLVPGYLSFVTGTLGADAVRAAAPEQAVTELPAKVIAGASDQVSVAGESAHARAPRPPAPLLSRPSRGRTLVGASLFVLGFAAVFTSYGAAFGSLGTLLL